MKKGISLHWTAGLYRANEREKSLYHGGVEVVDGFAVFDKWNNYYLSPGHTHGRNTDLIGLTICGMANATEAKWGNYPITKGQIEALCLAAAEIATLKKIPYMKIKTHAEYAILDGYGIHSGDPETRWDLARLEQGQLTREIAVKTGAELRTKIKGYMDEIKQGRREIRHLHMVNKFRGR